MYKISESIFITGTTIIPMADVQHIEKRFCSCDLVGGEKKGDLQGCFVITKHTTWNFEHDMWENAIWLTSEDCNKFIKSWCYYRYEVDIKNG